MSAAISPFPYEQQPDGQASRMCGAACLSMVYRSLGKATQQHEIWTQIAKHNRFGSLASTTHLMVRDARSRGFAAAAIQARHPLQLLRVCHRMQIRAILNHRVNSQSPAGHYTVLVGVDDNHVIVNDPYEGPSRKLTHSELLELWRPVPGGEITGYMLIGIAAEKSAVSACSSCHTEMPTAVACPACKEQVEVQPATLFQCANTACTTRMWDSLCCPWCDHTWNFSPTSSHVVPDAAGTQAASGGDPWNLGRAFAELDRFCALILQEPAAANHPEIRKHLAEIASSKEKLKLATAEALAHSEVQQQRLNALQETAKQKAAKHQKALEELSRPLPPLDAAAIGRAFLTSLGFIQ